MFLSGVASSRASKKKLTKLVTKKRKKFKKLEKKKLSSSGVNHPYTLDLCMRLCLLGS